MEGTAKSRGKCREKSARTVSESRIRNPRYEKNEEPDGSQDDRDAREAAGDDRHRLALVRDRSFGARDAEAALENRRPQLGKRRGACDASGRRTRHREEDNRSEAFRVARRSEGLGTG